MNARLAAALAVVLVPLLGYPLFTVAGGQPRFPTREECIHRPIADRPVDVVYARFDDPRLASDQLDRVLGVGFAGTKVLPDGCGRWKVVLENVPSLEIGREIQKEAETVDLYPTLELSQGS